MTSLIDMHVHYFPQELFNAIWRFFETESKGLWNINYKIHGEAIIQILKSKGVERFTTLVYAHKPGLADYLNGFVHEESEKHPELIPFGTLFVGDGNVELRTKKLFESYRFSGIKLHPFVSQEQIDDHRYFPAYEMMEAMGKILLCHPGSGPVYGQTDGAQRVKKILKQFPKLRTIVAHCGAFEYGDYHGLADDFENVYFDTAMNCVCTEVFENNCPHKSFFEKYQDRILFGTDFPNIPYDYDEQVESVKQFGLGQDIENKIYHLNARKILGLKS